MGQANDRIEHVKRSNWQHEMIFIIFVGVLKKQDVKILKIYANYFTIFGCFLLFFQHFGHFRWLSVPTTVLYLSFRPFYLVNLYFQIFKLTKNACFWTTIHEYSLSFPITQFRNNVFVKQYCSNGLFIIMEMCIFYHVLAVRIGDFARYFKDNLGISLLWSDFQVGIFVQKSVFFSFGVRIFNVDAFQTQFRPKRGYFKKNQLLW